MTIACLLQWCMPSIFCGIFYSRIVGCDLLICHDNICKNVGFFPIQLDILTFNNNTVMQLKSAKLRDCSRIPQFFLSIYTNASIVHIFENLGHIERTAGPLAFCLWWSSYHSQYGTLSLHDQSPPMYQIYSVLLEKAIAYSIIW